jgi:O-antigen/teichoic acid export membrane protein
LAKTVSQGHKSLTVTGLGWSFLGQGGTQAVSLILGVILARILSPKEFGLVAMVTVLTGFASIFTEMGFGAALIQRREPSQRMLSSVFWLNSATSLAMAGLFVLLAGPIARFYSEPALEALIYVLSPVFLLRSLCSIQNCMLARNLNFRAIVLGEFCGGLGGGGLAVALAFLGWGVWSLAAQPLMQGVVLACVLWLASPWRPARAFSWEAIKDLLPFGSSVAGDHTLGYWSRSLDSFLIGRYLGAEPLGAYSRAYSLMLFPFRNVTLALQRVMFPSLSKVKDDPPRVRGLFLQMIGGIAVITFPLTLGLFVVAHDFVLIVFGPQWAAMVPLVRILSLAALIQAVVAIVDALYKSQGRPDLALKVNLFLRFVMITCIVLGLAWGAEGVALGVLAATILAAYPTLFFAGRLVGLSFYTIVRTLLPLLLCSTIMSFTVILSRELLAREPSLASLLIQVGIGVSSYGLLLEITKPGVYRTIRCLVFEKLANLSSSARNKPDECL